MTAYSGERHHKTIAFNNKIKDEVYRNNKIKKFKSDWNKMMNLIEERTYLINHHPDHVDEIERLDLFIDVIKNSYAKSKIYR